MKMVFVLFFKLICKCVCKDRKKAFKSDNFSIKILKIVLPGLMGD